MSESGPRFYFDYVDPGSYLMEIRVARAAADAGVAVERVPYEVRPPPEPLLAPDDPAWTEYWGGMARELEAERVAVRRPGLVPWTRKAHELLLHAREHERGDEVHGALFRRFLVEGEDIGRVDVLLAVATAAGLDHTETKAVLDVDRHAAGVVEARALGDRMGVRGVPTLTTEGRILEGIHGEGEIGAFLHGTRAEGRGVRRLGTEGMREMAGYQRKTALGPSDVLSKAETLLPDRLGLSRTKGSDHGATYTGREGTVTVSAHRHGPYTEVVAQTDRLRTSRMDYEIQRFLNHLPYEPGDRGGPGSGDPG